jgi:hypothetical protein
VAAEDEREESKQVEQECDHRAGILSGSEPTYQTLVRRPDVGEGQVDDAVDSRFHSMGLDRTGKVPARVLWPTEDSIGSPESPSGGFAI